MQSAEEKIKNMASAAKEHADVYKAKLDEKAERAAARTPEEKEIAHERRKVKEAQAKMELHQAKARHAAEKLAGKQAHSYYGQGHNIAHEPPTHVYGHAHEPPAYYGSTAQPAVDSQGYFHQPVAGTEGYHQPVGTVDPMTGTAVPNYPLGGHPPGHKYKW